MAKSPKELKGDNCINAACLSPMVDDVVLEPSVFIRIVSFTSVFSGYCILEVLSLSILN